MNDTWTVNGVALSQLAWNIEQLPDGPAPKRGRNIEVASRDGTVWQPKPYDQRRIQIAMWVVDRDDNGRKSQDVYRANVDRLKRLWHSPELLTVVRTTTLTDGRVTVRTLLGEAVDSFEVATPSGMYIGRFVVDLTCPDPFWYERETVSSDQSGTFVLFDAGTVQTRRVTVRLHGPATDPTFTVEPAGTSFTWTGTIGTGGWVDVDAYRFTVVDQDGTSVAGALSRTCPAFTQIAPGRNVATLSSGTCDVTWQAAFL